MPLGRCRVGRRLRPGFLARQQDGPEGHFEGGGGLACGVCGRSHGRTFNHKILWFGVPGKVSSSLHFHQVTKKEGCVRFGKVYIMGDRKWPLGQLAATPHHPGRKGYLGQAPRQDARPSPLPGPRSASTLALRPPMSRLLSPYPSLHKLPLPDNFANGAWSLGYSVPCVTQVLQTLPEKPERTPHEQPHSTCRWPAPI